MLDELKSRKLEKEADFNNSYGFTQMLKDQIKGKNNSWAVRWYMSAFLKDMLTLYPGKSYVQNIGNDDSGTHCGNDKGNRLQNKLASIKHVQLKFDIEINDEIVSDFYKISQRSIFQRVKNLIRRLV